MSATEPTAPAPIPGTTTLDASTDSTIDLLLRAAIGPVGSAYYLPILARFAQADRASPSWNWAACLCTFNWMLFRGLWWPALVYACVAGGAALLVLAAGHLLTPFPASAAWSLWAGLATLLLLAPGFFGNAWLHAAYRRRIADALSRSPSLQLACDRLARQASSRPRLLWIVGANTVAAVLAAVVWLELPQAGVRPRVSGKVETAVAAAPPVFTASAPASPAAADAPGPPASAAVAPAAPASGPERADAAAQTAAAPPEAAVSGPVAVAAPAAAAAAGPVRTAPRSPVPIPAGAYAINVGLFAQDGNARRAHARLLAAGLPAFTQELQTGKGRRTRVRVGPYATRAQADAAAQEIRALGLEALVFRR